MRQNSIIRYVSSRSLTLIAAALFFCGCSRDPADNWALSPGDGLPSFNLPDAKGAPYNSEALKGKVVLMPIFATWCPPCLQELTALEEVHTSLKAKGIEVVAVSKEDTPEEVATFVKQRGFTFTVLSDPEGALVDKIGGHYLPRSVVISKEGRIQSFHVGFDQKGLQETITELTSLTAQ